MAALLCVVVAVVVVRAVTGGGPASGIGVYMSGNNAGLDAYTSGWSQQPEVASYYLNWDAPLPESMRPYARQGREIQVALMTKLGDGSWVRWSDIAAGRYDDHIVAVIDSLDSLGATVLLSLDVEPDANYVNGNGNVEPGQTPAEYVAAADHVADLVHAHSTHVRSLVWLAGFQPPAIEAAFLPAHSKLDDIGWDPYKTAGHPVDQTATQLFATFIDAVLVPHGYGDIARHITETGIQVDPSATGTAFSTQTQIAFYQGFPAAMKADDIQTVVWFRADSGAHDYIPTDPSVDAAFAAMLAGSG